jgi:hypothetical protein
MKNLLVALSVVLAGASAVNAEIYRPSVVGQTAALGAVAGALIGGHNGDRWAEGALIGAAAGAVLGAVADQNRPVAYTTREIAPVAVVADAPIIGAPAPTVVYVSTPAPAPRVVYVDTYSPPVVIRPVVHFSTGWNSGYYGWPRHYGHDHYRHRNLHWNSYHRPVHRHGHHRGPVHHGGGRHERRGHR